MRIVGTPIIPDSVDLLAAEDLAGWQMDTGGGIGTEYGQWLRRGEELVAQGQRPRPQPDRPTPPRTWREQAVYYHRPLAEDGTLDYEFFYEPDKTHVHPALDRLCLLLEPKGVRVHWLTDGTHERTGLTPDNATTEPPHRRGPAELPLKARAWNKVTLKLTGDTLGVALNGTDVYQRPLESTNQRTFGLFHYADDTAVRVRHVIMKGSWPKTLPPAEEMFRVGK